jgi:hypothetical protein
MRIYSCGRQNVSSESIRLAVDASGPDLFDEKIQHIVEIFTRALDGA